MYNKVADIYCKDPNLLLSVFNEMVESGMNEEETLSRLYAFCPTKRAALYLRSVLSIPENNILICSETRNSKDPSDSKEIEKYIKWIKTFDMKFDYIIQNPPYNGSLHLDFLEKGLDLLTEKGRMVIIEPATWLINVRKNGKAKKYDVIKKRIEGHVESVKIENFNKDFGTSTHVPFAITVIDFSKSFDEIEFTCCGEKKYVKSIYDCNLVGDYGIIWNIFNKIHSNAEMMSDHIWNGTDKNGSFHTFMDICASPSNKNASSNATPESNTWFTSSVNGDFFVSFLGVSCHPKYEITDTPQYSFKACGNSVTNKNYSDKYSTQIYGTRQELENWKHFIFNNKLPLFLNIVLTIDQHNCSKEFLPWLVDKQYTDEEINEMFGFTDDEIALIDRTIKKYERNSPWFKRYMCGPGSVDSDPKKEEEIINNFINNL